VSSFYYCRSFLIYFYWCGITDEKLHHALSKARAALIKLDKAINEPNTLQVEQHAGKFKINEILNTDILELFKKDIRFKQLITD